VENKDKEGAAVDAPEPTQFVRLAPGARRSWQTAEKPSFAILPSGPSSSYHIINLNHY